uniref:SWI/SNF-related matrix-associated actin-dependent regulator of chromatin subfamily A member 5 n=1 Tax=Strongyloides papillosus TaxID=174720 RepID=A0A0N5B4V1_STREA
MVRRTSRRRSSSHVPAKRKRHESSQSDDNDIATTSEKFTRSSSDNKSDDCIPEQKKKMTRQRNSYTSKPLAHSPGKFELLLNKIEEISEKVCSRDSVKLDRGDALENRGTKSKKRRACDREDDGINSSAGGFVFTQSPPFINGEMRDYQIFGLNWLVSLRENNVNGILADEMGLGKTLQTVSLIAYVKFFESKIKGVENNLPSIVIVPLSTLSSWVNEFKKWTTGIRVVVFHGDVEKRKEIIGKDLVAGAFDVVVTTYEMFSSYGAKLKKVEWEYVVVDEAHRIKNKETLLAKEVRCLNVRHKLLLTGTPLQNRLHELWALLNFLQPELFDDVDDFDSWFDSEKCIINEESVVQKLHKVLQPFMLRRIKKDVEKGLLPKKETTLFVGLTKLQKELYKKILMKDSEILINGNITKAKLLGIMQQLRKVVSHPYLFPGVEPGPPYVEGDHIIKCCAKLNLLDKLLTKLKTLGSRVLIFSQFIGTLDILEDYMDWRNFSFHRLDGSTSHSDRQKYIDEFQSKGSKTFAFMISTRAGGLGITLTAADVVIFYDIDWNPQMDLQAADRAHRIGQKKQVKVFRLVTEGTVDERVYETAERKLRLDNIIIQKGRMNEMVKEMNKDDIMKIIRSGISAINDDKNDQNDADYNLEDVIEESTKKFALLKEKLDKFGKPQEEMVFTGDKKSDDDYTVYKFEGNDYRLLKKLNEEKMHQQDITKERVRKRRFENLTGHDVKEIKKPIIIKNAPFPPDFTPHQYYFLCLPEYISLADKYVAFYRKSQNFKYYRGDDDDDASIPFNIKEKQAVIDNAKPLTDKEIKRMNKLKNKAFFSNWNSRDYKRMIKAMSTAGRNFGKIHSMIGEYDIGEIERYGTRLLDYAEENNMEEFLASVEKAEFERTKLNSFIRLTYGIYLKDKRRPERINFPKKIYSKEKSSMLIRNKNIELDKCVFHHFMTEIIKSKLSLENVSMKTIRPFATIKFENHLKRTVDIADDIELTCEGICRRFMSIIIQLQLISSPDAVTNDGADANDATDDEEEKSLNKILFKPLADRMYVIKDENLSEDSNEVNDVTPLVGETIQSNVKMIKTKKDGKAKPFLSSNGGVLGEFPNNISA